VEALGCSAAEEGGRRGGRNGRRGAVKLGLGAAPIMEEREWGSGWWPHGGKDGGGIRCVATARHALGGRGRGRESRGGWRVGPTQSGAQLTEAREQVTDGASYSVGCLN
jgi:hypothetical protein